MSKYDFSTAKVAIVTGGGSGIGRAICLSLARRGVKYIVAADIDFEGAKETVAQIEALALGLSPCAVKADVASEAGVFKLIDEVEEKCGKVDCFFANAGIGGDLYLKDASPKNFERQMAVNVYQSVHAARKLLPDLAKRGGCFAITASAAGLMMQMGSLVYTTTKHAARSVAEWLAVTYGDAGLHVACLCPQAVVSKMTTGLDATVASVDGILPAEAASENLCKALEAGVFFSLPHPQVGEYVKRKAENMDRWLAGMRRAQKKMFGPALVESRL